TLRRERDAGDRASQPLTSQLDREPTLVARAQSGRDPHALLWWTGMGHQQRTERIEHLGRPLESALDLPANALRRTRPHRIAERRGDRDRMRDALEIPTQARLVQLESERVGRDILESVRLVDDEVFGLRQEGAAHSSILQEKRVVHDDDPGVRGRLTRPLQVAVRPGGPLAAPLVARLVVRGDPRPELALSPHEVQLRAIAALGGGAPHERLGHEACFRTTRHPAAQDLPATGTQVIPTAYE